MAKKKTELQPTLEATLIRQSTRLKVFKLLAKHANGLTVADICKKLSLKGKPSFVKHEAPHQAGKARGQPGYSVQPDCGW